MTRDLPAPPVKGSASRVSAPQTPCGVSRPPRGPCPALSGSRSSNRESGVCLWSCQCPPSVGFPKLGGILRVHSASQGRWWAGAPLKRSLSHLSLKIWNRPEGQREARAAGRWAADIRALAPGPRQVLSPPQLGPWASAEGGAIPSWVGGSGTAGPHPRAAAWGVRAQTVFRRHPVSLEGEGRLPAGRRPHHGWSGCFGDKGGGESPTASSSPRPPFVIPPHGPQGPPAVHLIRHRLLLPEECFAAQGEGVYPPLPSVNVFIEVETVGKSASPFTDQRIFPE